MQNNYPITIHRLTGNEKFTFQENPKNFSLLDFWQCAYSDLVSNASRGILAEYIVAKTLDIPMTVRGEWDAYDLQMEAGTTIELKSAASVQSWAQEKLSNIKFSTGTTYAWDTETNRWS